MRPWFSANIASSRREKTPSLSKIVDRWRLTVSWLIEKCWATSLLVSPRAIADTISSWRRVKLKRFRRTDPFTWRTDHRAHEIVHLLRTERAVIGQHAPDAFAQRARRRFLQHDPADAELQRDDQLLRPDAAGQHDCSRKDRRGRQCPQDIQPGVGHGHIEQQQVRPQLPDSLHRGRAVARVTDHLQPGFRFEQPPEAVAENRMVARNQNAGGRCRR